MRAFEAELSRRLHALEQAQLRRHLRRVDSAQGRQLLVQNRPLINFSSNDYLGLASHPRLIEASARAMNRFGAGSGAARLVCGSLAPHHELEEELAEFKGTESALVFSSGYATSLGTIPALIGRGDIVVLDKLVHASLVDAAKLSGAKLRIFAHNDLNDLESILQWCDRQRHSAADTKILVVTESVFSMDGDFAPLEEIVALKERFGAWLMVDEAHATGLFGERRRGRCEAAGVSDRVEVQMGTLGKALGGSGGYIAGSRALIEYLMNKARSFIFSTAPPPCSAAAATAGIQVIRSTEGGELLSKLHVRILQFTSETKSKPAAPQSPIFPWIIGSETDAMAAAAKMLKAGIFVPAIRYPTVPRNRARLRITFSAAHTEEDIRFLSNESGALAGFGMPC